MAIHKYIVKLNHNEAVIKIVNDAPEPAQYIITLDGDLLKDNEALSGDTPKVNISHTEAGIEDLGVISIVRNDVTIANYFENTVGYSLPWAADSEENTSDIEVNFTLRGTIYIRMLKLQGYAPNFRPEQGIDE
jgi:hypothetical protein